MSQVMETPVYGSSPNGRMIETAPVADPQQGFDILKVLWRWKWLPILGAMIGTGLGYLYFSKQPQQYQATALIQVVDSLPPATRLQAYNAMELDKLSRLDESMVIKSQKVLRMAVDKGRLTEQPALRGRSADLIAGMLQGKELVVQPAAKDANTTLIQISYTCTDAELAAAVVNAVVDGYGDYLMEDFRTNGNKVYELVTKAHKELSESFKDLNERNAQFRANAADVLFTGDQINDPYAEAYKSINAELNALKTKRELIKGTLGHVRRARNEGRSPEAIILMLAAEAERHIAENLFAQQPSNSKVVLPRLESKVDTESARVEREQLFPLQRRERELLDEVGENHPSLGQLRKRISFLQEYIRKLADSEKAEQQELARLQQEADEAARNELQVEGISFEQRLALREEALQNQYESIALQITNLEDLAEGQLKSSKERQAATYESKLLNDELAAVQTLLGAYTERVKTIEILPQAGQRMLKELNLPSTGYFYGPKLSPYLLGGAAIGFIILSGLAVLMDLADRSYRNPDEIAQDLNMPVLGHIPVMEIAKVKKVVEAADASLTTLHHSRGRVSEAYRAVRTGLFFSSRGADLKVIQVTSPVPGDGKSTLSSNLAVTMAQSGRRVLLIDADFRRPRIAKIFGIDAEVGMAAVVADKAELDDAIYASPVANLSVMPGGKRPSNPAELLSSRRFGELMEILRGKFDIIIVDTPPLLAVSDPGAVAAIVDGVVLTMRLRRNVKPLATRATKILESVDARLLGVVVNGVSAEAGYGYSYGYNDYRYAYRYGSNYRYGYGSKYGYGGRYGSYAAGYIEEPHDVEQGPPPAKES